MDSTTKRSCGILLHISSLPSPYGIGSFGKAAYEFVDFLVQAKHEFWQVLPLTPTSFGDSPYQSPSCFAGNEYFIDLDLLVEDGLLTSEEISRYEYGKMRGRVDYETLFYNRFKVLRHAFDRFDRTDDVFLAFCTRQEMTNYALYKALKYEHNQQSWHEWEDCYKFRHPDALDQFAKSHADEIDFWLFLQFMFWRQWSHLKAYANDRGIKIFGDIPIYIAYDSVEVWLNPQIVQLDKKLNMTLVAGCPPDCFTEDGQLWGNPVYDWDYMQSTNFDWWISRLCHSMKLYDVLRIDHFRGFEKYYAIDASATDARVGEWLEAKGIQLFREAEKRIPNLNIIAEDLGFIDEPCRAMFDKLGYPGMKILQFAFDGNPENEHHPDNYTPNFVVYTGTHDNEPLMMSLAAKTPKEYRAFETQLVKTLDDYGIDSTLRTKREAARSIITLAYKSKAFICIIPMQDLLFGDQSTRMNLPATISTDNWSYRITQADLSKELAATLKSLSTDFGRS